MTCCHNLDAADMSHSLKKWSSSDTARHCGTANASCKHLSSLRVCVCVWYGLATGASLRFYLRHDKTTCNIRASGAPLQTQPYLTPNIPRGQSGARVAQTRPDKTSHRLAASHPTCEPGAQAGNAPSKCMCVCVCSQGAFTERRLDSPEQQCDITVTEIICSEFFFRPANRARG